MKRVVGNPMRGQLTVPEGTFVACTIGPQSEYDQLFVNDKLACAGRVTWLDPGQVVIRYARGPLSPAGGNGPFWVAELILFECVAEVLAYTRPAREYSKSQINIATAQIGSTGGSDNTQAFTLVVPFVGRRAARIALVSIGARTEWVVYGRKWFPADSNGQATQPGAAGASSSSYTGSGAPIGAFKGYMEKDLSGTVAAPRLAARGDSGVVTASNAHAADVILIGGTDSFESYDELVIQWQKYVTDAASTVDAYVTCCVLGEEGQG